MWHPQALPEGPLLSLLQVTRPDACQADAHPVEQGVDQDDGQMYRNQVRYQVQTSVANHRYTSTYPLLNGATEFGAQGRAFSVAWKLIRSISPSNSLKNP